MFTTLFAVFTMGAPAKTMAGTSISRPLPHDFEVLEQIRRKRILVDIPFGLAALQARVLSILPNPPVTPDQVEMLKRDNVVSSGALTLAALGIAPVPVEAILPSYVDRFRRGGWYARERAV